MAKKPRLRRSAGSRTALDVLRAGFRKPSEQAVAHDIAALHDGRLEHAPMLVTCFIRGTGPNLPPKLTQGELLIQPNGLTWRRFWRKRAEEVALDQETLHVEAVRDVASADTPPVKPLLYRVVVCTQGPQTVDLAVPTVDVPLVLAALGADT